MAFMDPSAIPTDRDHLDADDRRRLRRLDELLASGSWDAAKDVAEELWAEATDAHRGLYQGLANALTALIAHAAGQHRGAAQIAARTGSLLAPYPRHALALDLNALLAILENHS